MFLLPWIIDRRYHPVFLLSLPLSRVKYFIFTLQVLFLLVLAHSTFYWDTNTHIPLFLDINECAAKVNPCVAVANSVCKNKVGSYNCQYKDGFVRKGPNCKGATQVLWSVVFLLFLTWWAGGIQQTPAILLVPAEAEFSHPVAHSGRNRRVDLFS